MSFINGFQRNRHHYCMLSFLFVVKSDGTWKGLQKCRQMSESSFLKLVPYWNGSAWWRHQMETFSAPLALSVGNSPVTGDFPAQRPVTLSFCVFFYLRLNKRLSKQYRRRWLETLSRSLWRHSNGTTKATWISCEIGRTASLTDSLAIDALKLTQFNRK